MLLKVLNNIRVLAQRGGCNGRLSISCEVVSGCTCTSRQLLTHEAWFSFVFPFMRRTLAALNPQDRSILKVSNTL